MILSPIVGPPVSTFVYESSSGATHLWLPLLSWPHTSMETRLTKSNDGIRLSLTNSDTRAKPPGFPTSDFNGPSTPPV
jgi:hypothetical protein